MDAEHGFPDTQNTWIINCLSGGQKDEVQRHLMAVYLEPLQRMMLVRFRIDNERALDLVHGFFASRLGRSDYLRQWRDRELRLRHWLWNGLCYYVREHARDERRLRTESVLPDIADQNLTAPGAELDRAFATSIIREASRRAKSACARDGFAEHWIVFSRRYQDDESVATIARDLGIRPERAIVMLRAPKRRFRQEIANLLANDGVPLQEVPRALRELLELMP